MDRVRFGSRVDVGGGPERLAEPESRRPVKALGLLLILQVVGLAGLGLYEFTLIDWRNIGPNTRPSEQLMEVISYGVFAPSAVLMVLSALGFLFMRRRGWLAAAIAQALCLGACVQLYSVYEPYYVYPIMVYCILMILYLNSQNVRAVFRRGRLAPEAARRSSAMFERAQAEALLRRFEPVVRSTKGDRFFPMDVEPYVRSASLWVQRPGEEAVNVVPAGKLTLEGISQQPLDAPGTVHFLRFADLWEAEKGLSRRERLNMIRRRATQGLEDPRKAFRAGRGRLARVGYFSRFMDALYSIALLARGRVPGESAAVAALSYSQIMAEREHYRYHGRVLRQDGWIVLQYWLFYPFNDWRSGFFGANDHEADWEKVFVFLSESDAGVRPEWVAYAAHNYTGDNLRRRWDDPELEKVGEHPVIFVGAGSHASYFAPGEYLTELSLPLPGPIARTAVSARSFWRRSLGQYAGDDEDGGAGYLYIPFVDYARGDGLTVGEGGDKDWDPPRLMQEPLPDWVSGYRGLWGLYARDPFEGEDAPAGPMYNRDKTVARAWYDPVGWAGLDKVPPPNEALGAVTRGRDEISARCDALRVEIDEKSRELKRLGAEVAAMRGMSHLRTPYTERTERIAELSGEVDGLRKELATDEAVSQSLAGYSRRLEAGERDPARTHISRAHQPASEVELHVSRVAELWAAISVTLMLVAFLGIMVFDRDHLVSWLVLSIALFAFVEAGFRGRLVNFVSSVNIGLGAVAALIVVYEFFWELVVAAVILVGLYVLWDNLRELRR